MERYEIDTDTLIHLSGIAEESADAFEKAAKKSMRGERDRGYGILTKMGLPERGWFIDTIYTVDPDISIDECDYCDRCKLEKLRFRFVMSYPGHNETIEVGCVCAGWMYGNGVEGKQKIQKMRSDAEQNLTKLKRNRERKREASAKKIKMVMLQQLEEDRKIFSKWGERKYAHIKQWEIRDRDLKIALSAVETRKRYEAEQAALNLRLESERAAREKAQAIAKAQMAERARQHAANRVHRVEDARDKFLDDFSSEMGWRISQKGNPMLYRGGYRHTIYQKYGKYGVVSLNRTTDETQFSNGLFPTEEGAAEYIFDNFISQTID